MAWSFKKVFDKIFFRKKKEESQKSIIRRRIRNKKSILSDSEKSESAQKVFDKVEQLPAFINAKSVLLYWSLSDELSTHSFIEKWCKSKLILLPMVKGDDMLIKPFLSMNDLYISDMGIWEPSTQNEYLKHIDLVIVPGVAFDKYMNRLGRGKGYYDRYFTNKNVIKIGICYDFQLLENVPVESFDVKMNYVITPNYIIE